MAFFRSETRYDDVSFFRPATGLQSAWLIDRDGHLYAVRIAPPPGIVSQSISVWLLISCDERSPIGRCHHWACRELLISITSWSINKWSVRVHLCPFLSIPTAVRLLLFFVFVSPASWVCLFLFLFVDVASKTVVNPSVRPIFGLIGKSACGGCFSAFQVAP